jgi:anthranilate phosphoribosyltransferase
MKALAPIRTALGIRTVFNLLGPLTNPAAPRYLLVGAYDARTAELMAGTLAGMHIERGWVVHGASGWDEATPIGSFVAFDVAGDQVTRREVNPEEFGIARCAPGDLKGGDAKANLKALLDVFEGRDQGPHLDTLVLQCGLALVISGRAQTVAEGIALARAVIDSGKALAWLQRLRAFALYPDASKRSG